jgi:hypothetical protein
MLTMAFCDGASGVGKSSIINALRFNALADTDEDDQHRCLDDDENDEEGAGDRAERRDSHASTSTSAPIADDGYRERGPSAMGAAHGSIGDPDGLQARCFVC